jgi:hypothetical protein
MLAPLVNYGATVAVKAMVPIAFNAMVPTGVMQGNLNATNAGGAIMVAASTFVSYFGIEAYKSIASAINNGLNNHAGTAPRRAIATHAGEPDNPRSRVFIAAVVAIIFQWLQHRGAIRMRDATMIEAARRRSAETMDPKDKRRLEQHGGAAPMMLYHTYSQQPYYTGGKPYMDFSTMDFDLSSIIVRPILNVLVGISVQVEQIFFQTGNFDHLHVLNKLFQSFGLYEIVVYATRKHEWSLIQTALMTFLKTPTGINARRRRVAA